MQTVGAQWLLVDEPNAAALVSLVQVATTLPMMLLALPGGVLADSFDRRRLLITVQAYLFVVAILLTVLTAAGQMPPALLLAFTFALGRGRSGADPGMASHDARPRPQDRAASGGRAGFGEREPGLCGRTGAGGTGDRLPGWRPGRLRPQDGRRGLVRGRTAVLSRARSEIRTSPERFLPALRSGGRYIWHEPVVRRIMLRAILFVVPAMALYALLPLTGPLRRSCSSPGSACWC